MTSIYDLMEPSETPAPSRPPAWKVLVPTLIVFLAMAFGGYYFGLRGLELPLDEVRDLVVVNTVERPTVDAITTALVQDDVLALANTGEALSGQRADCIAELIFSSELSNKTVASLVASDSSYTPKPEEMIYLTEKLGPKFALCK